MVNIVTKRFIECYKSLMDAGAVRSARQFSTELDYSPQSWNKILKHDRDVTVELIRTAIDRFGFSPEYIFCGHGEPFKSDKAGLEDMTPDEVSAEDIKKITHVPVAAAAGYLTQFHDPVFVEDLNCFTLPGLDLNHGVFRAFDVVGDSMEPGIFQGEILVCSQVDPELWKFNLRNDFVYVILTHNEIVVKRIQNKIKEKNMITLISDNSFYEPVDIQIHDIKEIWFVKMKISPFSHARHSNQMKIETVIDDLKSIIANQSAKISRMEQALERSFKNERQKV